jgi:hypothetical protein
MIRNATAYEDDFYAWTQEQARLLRSGQVTGLDLEHLAEEIESMGSQQRREMRSINRPIAAEAGATAFAISAMKSATL